MADTTVSALTPGVPAGNNIVPYSTGSTTLGAPVNALFKDTNTFVVIGSAMPAQYRLDVYHDNFNAIRAVGNSTNSIGIYMDNKSAGARSWGIGSVGSAGPSKAGNLTIFDHTAQLPRFNIDATGNVGIGVNDPQAKLDVNGTIKATALQVPGCIIQVKHAVKTNIQLMNLLSFEDVSGLSVSITPKALGSLFLVQVQLSVSTISTQAPYIRITRNGNAIGTGDAAGNRTQCNAFMYTNSSSMVTVPINYVDAPSYSDLSPIIYKVQLYANSGPNNGNVGINCYALTGGDADAATQPRASSSIIVQEIAG